MPDTTCPCCEGPAIETTVACNECKSVTCAYKSTAPAELARLRQEVKDNDASFELHHWASMDAIKFFIEHQKSWPERTEPDTRKMWEWYQKTIAELRQENEKLKSQLQGITGELKQAIIFLPDLELAKLWKSNAEGLVKHYSKKQETPHD